MNTEQKEKDEKHGLENMKDVLAEAIIDIDSHLKLPTLPLPYKAKNDNRIVTIINAPCSQCGYPLVDLRGTVEEVHTNIITINGVGFCVYCLHTEDVNMKWYKDGRWVVKTDGEWIDLQATETDDVPWYIRWFITFITFFK